MYGIRRVTYLVNDGFLKPSLIYWMRVFASRAPFSLYEECLGQNVRALRDEALNPVAPVSLADSCKMRLGAVHHLYSGTEG